PLSTTPLPNEAEPLNERIRQAHHLIGTQDRINPGVQYRQILQAAIHKHRKLMENLKQDIEDSRDADRYRLFGQLLQSNFQAIPLQQNSVTLTNFYSHDREPVTIPLNPNHQPSDQIEHYFRKYKKMKKAAELQSQRIKMIRQELEGFSLELERIDQLSPTDLEQRIKKLRQRINLSPKTGTGQNGSSCCHEYRLPSGKPLLVGKSSDQNDQLTFKVARPFDYWFHARDFKGSHVIVRLENKTGSLSRHDIELAAGIAAYYSKARHSTLVPVDYTLRRYVRKPQNAAPGFVIFQREKSVMVHPLSPQELFDQLTQEVTP
nr:DUF814 domain-containing protein [Candidatus Delongbacteria bacterium]